MSNSNYIPNAKALIIRSIVRLMKNISFKKYIKWLIFAIEKKKKTVKNYAAKSHFKIKTGVDTSKFPKKDDLASVNSNVDDLDIDKFKNCSCWFK